MTLTRADDAEATYRGGFSCAQSVCLAFAEDYGIDRETALKLSCALGGGMGHTNNTCGAVTGALMVIGMKYGRTRLDDMAAKEKTYEVTKEFIAEFLRRNQSLRCTDLLGYNLSNSRELGLAKEKGVFKTKCPLLVRSAAEILEEIL
ncbi:C-GCAxxG-C-C family protein [uncultured Methanoregula sp.]|uniref:C-GCAxxG-C-C family protein n=1 Tax=uncultured Methanoregula sp. TaxID=1005933 RepID=UPI002AAAF3BC|nr:C-GCAxxG-C-C family protein [uncultured Methanoregula sp.]